MRLIESLANRLCCLQCEMLCVGGDTRFDLESVNFTFMLWDHTACDVRMGCIGDGDQLMFVVRYDSVANGRRLFMGTPWLADRAHHALGRELASMKSVDQFLQQAQTNKKLQTNVVFDGNLAVDEPIGLHLQLDHPIDGKTLLIKNVAECRNVLLVIDMFE